MKTFNYVGKNAALSVASKAMNCAELKATMDICMAAHSRFFKQYEDQSKTSSFEVAFRAIPKERVKQLLADPSLPASPQERIACGYISALDFIDINFSMMSFCEKDILTLYRKLAGAHNEPTDALYRKDESAIEMTVNGKRLSPITPIPAVGITDALIQMYAAYIAAEDDKSINNLLLVPYVVIDFLSISPFRSENLKMALLITYLLLRKCGYDIVRFVPFEEKATVYFEEVHSHLQVHISDWDNGNGRYQGFSRLFYDALSSCYSNIYTQYVKKFGDLTEKKPDKPAPKAALVKQKILSSKKPISKRDIAKQLFDDVSQDTVEEVLREMVKSGELVKIGVGKKTMYDKPKPVQKAEAIPTDLVSSDKSLSQKSAQPKPTNAIAHQQGNAQKLVQQTEPTGQKPISSQTPPNPSTVAQRPTATPTAAQIPAQKLQGQASSEQKPAQINPANAAAPRQVVTQNPIQQTEPIWQKSISSQTSPNPSTVAQRPTVTPTAAQISAQKLQGQASAEQKTAQINPTNAAAPQQVVMQNPIQQTAAPAGQKSVSAQATANSDVGGQKPIAAQPKAQTPLQRTQGQTPAEQSSTSASSQSLAEFVKALGI